MPKRYAYLGAAGALAGILSLSACSAPLTSAPEASLSRTDAITSPTRVIQTGKSDPAPDHEAAVNAMDRQFVPKASHANLEEVALGILGQRKAHTESVKAYAKRMETDHSKAEQDLMTAAQKADLTVPTDLTPDAKATMKRLSKLSGMEFDREYMKVMVMGHKKAVQLFTMEAEKGGHPALTGYAKKSLPTLKEHLAMAEEILSQLK